MDAKTPITRYRPIKVSDDQGGSTETLAAGVTVFGDLRVHKGRTSFIVDANEDISKEDILEMTDL